MHSIYFDTLRLDMFSESEEGTLPRKKIRIRWYDRAQSFTFEKKISSIEGRFKITETLSKIRGEQDIYTKKLYDQQYGYVFPSLCVDYQRSYFEHEAVRITFDEKIKYRSRNSNFCRVYTDPERVIEIKAPADCSDDFIETLIPGPTSRFSKYSRGLLLSTGAISEF